MKKNGVIAFAIILTLIFSTVAYGATTPATPAITTTGITTTDLSLENGMVFTGEEMKMSLEQVKTLVMTSSAGIEMAKINMAANKAKTESYYQAYRKATAGYEVPGFGTMTASRTEKEMGKLAASFALAQSENNYQAEINNLNANTIKTYFELQQAINATAISKSNLATQETILKNTNTKFRLGVSSKQDVLKAEIASNQAKVDLSTAQSRESLARMSYNVYFGFPLMQKVVLTDSLATTELSKITLKDAIDLALKNRNEITGAAFALKYKQLNLTNVGNNYSKTSSYYLQAQADLMLAQKNAKEIPLNIELDVRNKYMTMMIAKSSVDLGKLSADKATETYRLAKLQYDMGMATLTDVEQAQAGAYGAQLQYSQNLLNLKLAVVAYDQATTVGTYSVMF